MCDHMKRTVIYNGDRISVTLTRCGECSDCYNVKVEMPMDTCTATQELRKLWVYPKFSVDKVIIGDLKK